MLSVKIESDSLIDTIHISYIIYRPENSEFKIFSPTDFVETDYNIAAVFAFAKSKPVTEVFGIIIDRRQCLGTGCSNTCISKKECFSLNGVLSESSCHVCGKNERAL